MSRKTNRSTAVPKTARAKTRVSTTRKVEPALEVSAQSEVQARRSFPMDYELLRGSLPVEGRNLLMAVKNANGRDLLTLNLNDCGTATSPITIPLDHATELLTRLESLVQRARAAGLETF